MKRKQTEHGEVLKASHKALVNCSVSLNECTCAASDTSKWHNVRR